MITIPTAQYRAALALAHAYGHQWGSALGKRDPRAAEHDSDDLRDARKAVEFEADKVGRVSLNSIVVASDLLGYGPVGGIAAPTVNESGVVVHTTASGRLSWGVTETGCVFLTVCRPNAAVLRVEVWTSRAGERVCSIDSELDADDVAYARHILATEEALRACGCSAQEIDRTLAPAWRVCPDAQEHLGHLRASIESEERSARDESVRAREEDREPREQPYAYMLAGWRADVTRISALVAS